jgi:hypothetical protein
VSEPEVRWYVAGFGDGQTHRGRYSIATRSVHSVCGAEFQALPVGWPPKPGPLPGSPPDPEQICQQCAGSVTR